MITWLIISVVSLVVFWLLAAANMYYMMQGKGTTKGMVVRHFICGAGMIITFVAAIVLAFLIIIEHL